MDEIRRITQSEIKDFKRCRRKWWLRNVRKLKLKREKKYGAASLGNRVHRGLELLPTVGLEAALADIDARVQKDRLMVPEQEDKIAKEGTLARIMIEGCVQWMEEEGIDEDFVLVGPEHTLSVPWDVIDPLGRQLELIGKLDQQVERQSTGELMFRDWKTVDDFSRVHLLRNDEQMKHYGLLERIAAPARRTGGGLYTMLRKVKRTATAKPPFYMMEEVRLTDPILNDYLERAIAETEDLLRVEAALAAGGRPASLAYPNPTRDCSWDCEFLPVCPMFDDGSDAEGMLSSLYAVGDPLARYNPDHDGD